MLTRILLVNPPIEDFYQTEIRQEPVGLKYLTAVLQDKGYEVNILDALIQKLRRNIPLPAQLSYLKEFYPPNDLSPFKLFTRYKHFGMDFEEIQKQLRQIKPQLIGITANFTPYFEMALKVAQMCKRILPNVPVVMGGHHVTTMPNQALQSGYVDYVVLGEGELTFLKLIEVLSQVETKKLKNIPGIAFRDDSEIIINPVQQFIEDLDSLPYPLTSQPLKYKMIITSRGCPRECNFCSIEKVMGKRVRLRTITSVVGEIRVAIEQGIHQIDFEDDNLTLNKNRARKLLQALIDNFQGQNITFSAMNGLDAETLDEELISMMKAAGFEWLNIPLVSGSPEVQRLVQRRQSNEKFLEIVSLANKHGLKVVAYLILGLPEDTLKQMLQDIIFLASQKLLLGPSIFYPPPGTSTYENCLSRGYIQKGDYLHLRSSAFPVETEHFQRVDLVTLFRLVRVINFLKHIIDRTLDEDENFYNYLNKQISNDEELTYDHKLSPIEIGHLLLDQFFFKGELKGLKLKTKVNNCYQYEWIEYVHSPTLVQNLLLSLKGQRIPGVVKECGFLV